LDTRSGRSRKPKGTRCVAPGPAELDLFDPVAVGMAVRDVDALFHLARRIQPLDRMQQPEAWRENDRLRAEAPAILVDAALAADVKTYIQPTVTFVYPAGRPGVRGDAGRRCPGHLALRAAADGSAIGGPRPSASSDSQHRCWMRAF
jgi:hypothetical protein